MLMGMDKAKALVMNAADNVATVLEEIDPQTEIPLTVGDETIVIRVAEKIRFGHKFAIRAIPRGEFIIKYGEPIGVATENILAGRHVHVHNLESTRGRGDR
jgi:altronate dehydratase small subunit